MLIMVILLKRCMSINHTVMDLDVWGNYVVISMYDYYHLFYRPSFMGLSKFRPYMWLGSILCFFGLLLILAGFTYGFLTVLGIFLIIVGLVLQRISRYRLVIESHGGLCIEYEKVSEITGVDLQTIVKKLEGAEELV